MFLGITVPRRSHSQCNNPGLVDTTPIVDKMLDVSDISESMKFVLQA